MKNLIRISLPLLMGSSLAAFGIGYIVATTEQLDTEVTDSGILSTTTTQVLSATVQSLRKENKLQVFTYKGAAKVRTGTDGPLFFNGAQELNVPAVVRGSASAVQVWRPCIAGCLQTGPPLGRARVSCTSEPAVKPTTANQLLPRRSGHDRV